MRRFPALALTVKHQVGEFYPLENLDLVLEYYHPHLQLKDTVFQDRQTINCHRNGVKTLQFL